MTDTLNKNRRSYFVDSGQVYEKSEPKDIDFDLGNPSFTASVLQVKDGSEIDFDIEVMARVIDSFLKGEIVNENLKVSEMAFKNKLDNLTQKLGISINGELLKGNNLKVLERLFSEVAVNNKKSSKTFIKQMREEVKKARVKDLKNKLKQLI